MTSPALATCAECDSTAEVAGLCRRHYNRNHYTRKRRVQAAGEWVPATRASQRSVPTAPESGVRTKRRRHLPVDLRTRADCTEGGNYAARPCPFSTCRHHLGAQSETCSLDVAERGPITLEEVATLIPSKHGGGPLVKERVRQIERDALATLRTRVARLGLTFDAAIGFAHAADDDSHPFPNQSSRV